MFELQSQLGLVQFEYEKKLTWNVAASHRGLVVNFPVIYKHTLQPRHSVNY